LPPGVPQIGDDDIDRQHDYKFLLKNFRPFGRLNGVKPMHHDQRLQGCETNGGHAPATFLMQVWQAKCGEFRFISPPSLSVSVGEEQNGEYVRIFINDSQAQGSKHTVEALYFDKIISGDNVCRTQ
jgi:hypothetical protein